MSLIDLILGQKIILLSAGFAVLVLLAAITLALVARIRRRSALKARQKALAAQTAVEEDDGDVAVTAVRAQAAPRRQQAETPRRAAAQPAAPVTSAAVQPGQPPKPSVSFKPAQQPQETQSTTQEPETSSAMQDLLSSVFQDDEALERFQVLLRGLDTVNINELESLCNTVANQLRGRAAG